MRTAIGEAAFGAEHADLAVVHKELAALHERLGESAESETSLRRALAIDEAAFGPAHLEVAATVASLGALLHAHGRSADAEPLCLRGLAVIALDERAPAARPPFVRTTAEICRAVLHACGASDEDIARRLGKAVRELRAALNDAR